MISQVRKDKIFRIGSRHKNDLEAQKKTRRAQLEKEQGI